MRNNFPKKEHLTRQKDIVNLFECGNTISTSTIRLYYKHNSQIEYNRVLVAVSKRFFKKAVDRNYYKRVMREVYRQNKYRFANSNSKIFDIAFVLSTAEKQSFEKIEQDIVTLLKKLYSKNR